MDTLRGGGFPDETARLAEQLTNTDFRETLSGEFTQFYAAHEQDRSLLRFHYHKLENIWQSLRNLSLPRRAYSSEMAAVPELGRFITEDEIDHALDRGSGVEGGKSRIYEYFTADHTGKEKAAFLKDEYGIGGRSHAVSGASHSDESHDSRGIVLKKADCANVELSWTKVAARIDSLIQKDRFLTPEEKARFEQLQREKEAERELPTQAQTDYNAIKEAHPDDIVLFQVGDFFEIYGEDAKQAAELLDLNLTTRAIPGAGRVEMCGVPAHNLEQYVERLRDIHEKPVSGSRQKATGLPSGAREDLSWTITRTFGSRFTRPISRTLLAAARKSIEPNPRYALCPPAALLRCPIRITAHPVRSATSARRRKMGRTSFALFMSALSPIYACIGSRIIRRAPFCTIAFSMRSSDRVSSRLASSITSTRSRSASASIKRGLTVSPKPSSAV